MQTTNDSGSPVGTPPVSATFLGHPAGLFLLFLVEMWERFSYYGMRALLVLYLTSPVTGMRKPPGGAATGFNPGPGWPDSDASTLYGWYTGLAYLTPVVGGIIADKLIGTHRSMVVGGVLIMLGHLALAVSGMWGLGQTPAGMSVFIAGLAVIVLGTGHFKPSVSVMVGQLYAPNDPRRDGAFSIFYMGINLGAFLCAFVCGTLGEKVGWHWGFGSAAVGMFLGLALYVMLRPKYLKGIGLPPATATKNWSPVFLAVSLGLALVAGLLFHAGAFGKLQDGMSEFVKNYPTVALAVGVVLFGAAVVAAGLFTFAQRSGDRGPVATIFIFMFFNAFFWLAFEQAGSSMTLFTDRYTDTGYKLPQSVADMWNAQGIITRVLTYGVGGLLAVLAGMAIFRFNRQGKYAAAVGMLIASLFGAALFIAGVLKEFGYWPQLAAVGDIATSWFQSVNPFIIFVFAPVFAALWTWLGRKKANPSQPLKISFGLILLGLGFLVLVMGARTINVSGSGTPSEVVNAKAAIWFLLGAYLLHTLGELCLSPTGLSYVTKAAPVRFVSLLMGIWFVSSFIANLGGGLIASQTEKIERGEITLWWSLGKGTGSIQADFFFLFVVTSIGAGLVILALYPLLKRMQRDVQD